MDSEDQKFDSLYEFNISNNLKNNQYKHLDNILTSLNEDYSYFYPLQKSTLTYQNNRIEISNDFKQSIFKPHS